MRNQRVVELVNQTVVPARLFVAEMSDEDCRGGMLVAKATFEIEYAGRSSLVTDDPVPILAAMTPTSDVGHMPPDLLPREDPAFEVYLLAACHAPRAEPVQRAKVSMMVGAVTRHLLVTGDRVWVGEGPGATISAPVPFTRMPLTYERAFGGSAEVQIDPRSTYPVCDMLNSVGRGFDASEYVPACAAQFECPPGFPVLAPGPRRLPNVEDPGHTVRSWSDRPPPASWAAIPFEVGFAHRAMDARKAHYGNEPTDAQIVQAGYFRAHPDWTFPEPPAMHAPVRVRGVHPAADLAFTIPALRVVADYEIGPRRGVVELLPQALIILGELTRFCVVYRKFFRFNSEPSWHRSFRLRLVEGWNGAS